jgi:drug/metabolite transporter (DMT)-like permease
VQPTQITDRQPVPWPLFGLVAVLWGVPFLLIKVAVDAGVSPVVVALSRVALGALVLAPLARTRVSPAELCRRWRPLVVVAACDVAAPFVLVNTGERSVSSSLAGILVASTPLFVALLALRFDRSERPRRRQLVGLLLGFAGVAVLLGLAPDGGGGSLAGSALILLAALGYAVATLVIKRHLSDLPSVAVSAATLSLSALLLAAAAAATAHATWPSTAVLGALLALGVACTGAAFWTYYALIAAAGATRAAVSVYLTPGVAVLVGVAVRGEAFTAATAGGLILILVGCSLSTAAEEQRSRAGRTPDYEPKCFRISTDAS